MTNVVSVITPVHAPAVRYLVDAYRSLVEQEMPAGWTWQWVVQEDGRTGKADEALPTDARISRGEGTPGGPAVARNMALQRCEGTLVRVLDADDQLMPGALAREIAVLTEMSDIGWTTTSVLDLMPDGSTVGWQHADPPGGKIPGASVLEYFEANMYRLPVHPATLCIRRNIVLALGGWMALPGGEDTGLLLALSAVCDGYFVDEPGLLYRKHEAQATNRSDWSGTPEWHARMDLVKVRANALRDFLLTASCT